jgi:hypothetical protein
MAAAYSQEPRVISQYPYHSHYSHLGRFLQFLMRGFYTAEILTREMISLGSFNHLLCARNDLGF